MKIQSDQAAGKAMADFNFFGRPVLQGSKLSEAGFVKNIIYTFQKSMVWQIHKNMPLLQVLPAE